MDPSLTQIPSVAPARLRRDFRRSNKRTKPRFTAILRSMVISINGWPISSRDLYVLITPLSYSIESQSISLRSKRKICRSTKENATSYAFIEQEDNRFFILAERKKGDGGNGKKEGRGRKRRRTVHTRWNRGRERGRKGAAVEEEEEEAGCEFGGSRFPRDVGRKVPAGPVLSPRQDDQPAVSNIKPTCTGSLSSTRYPNLPSDRPTEIPPRIPPRIPLYPRVTTAVCHQNLRLVGLPPRSLHLTRFPLGGKRFFFDQLTLRRERERKGDC